MGVVPGFGLDPVVKPGARATTQVPEASYQEEFDCSFDSTMTTVFEVPSRMVAIVRGLVERFCCHA